MQSHQRLSSARLIMLSIALGACAPRVFESSEIKLVEPSVPATAAAEEARVQVSDNKIIINEKIQFDYNQATIRRESYDLLAEIAEVINQNPRLLEIRVEGHASSEGSYEHNVGLSRRRAKAVVEHLVERGEVDAGRLASEGYGPDQPIAPNSTEAGREANRRVEFTILEQEYTEKRTVIDPETGEETVETEKKVD